MTGHVRKQAKEEKQAAQTWPHGKETDLRFMKVVTFW
jgi:hypothetical protein